MLRFCAVFKLTQIRYFDIDKHAMHKFPDNMQPLNIPLYACKESQQTVAGADIIITCTADKNMNTILSKEMLNKAVFINALDGDCPGKTELSKNVLESTNIVVEYLPQSKIEGEIQQLNATFTCPELHQIIQQKIALNVSQDGTIIYDSVGFALEDFSVLRLVYQLPQQHHIGQSCALLAAPREVKNLYALLSDT